MYLHDLSPGSSDTRLDAGRDRALLRTGAVSALAGVVMALVQSAIDPRPADDPREAIEKAAQSHLLTFSRVLDMTAFLLMLFGVAVLTRMLQRTRGAAWARVGLSFYTVSAAAGAIATMVVGSLPDVAAAWAEAPASRRPGYVAVFDSVDNISGGIFAVSWASLGVFGLCAAAALARSDLCPRPLTWIAAASGLASVTAILLGIALRVEVAFVLLVLGLLLSYVVIATAGVTMWRQARIPETAPEPSSVTSA